MSNELFYLPAHVIAARYKEGDFTAVGIATSFIERIREKDKLVGAFLALHTDRVLDRARLLDAKRKAGKPLGLLAGVPVGIKDNIHIRGELTTCASLMMSNYKALFDATVVKNLELEDALLLGKTNLDEFAMGSSTENSAFFPTKNPWNLKCVPGGSSGGSAAAVAARFCPLALGSDTGGSIRQPAALTGIVGFKPTYGRVSRYGLVAFGSSLDQIGPFSTNVKDSAMIMEILGRHCDQDMTSTNSPPPSYTSLLEKSPHSLVKGDKLRVGVPFRFLEGLEKEGRKLFEESLNHLKELGAEIVEVDLDILKHSIAVYYVLATAEAASNLARFDGIKFGYRSENASTLADIYHNSKGEGFGREVQQRIFIGTSVLSSGIANAHYKKSQKVRTLIIEAYNKAFQACDIIAMPTSPTPACEIGEISDPIQMYLQDIYTISTNLAGLPCISVPCGFWNEKPFGLQLIGPQMEDTLVLNVAHAFEKVCPHSCAVPPQFSRGVN